MRTNISNIEKPAAPAQPSSTVRQKVRPETSHRSVSPEPDDASIVAAPKVDEDMIKRIESIQMRLATLDVKVKINVDQATGKHVIKVIDRETEEVVREVPPEEMLKLEASIDRMIGLLFDRQA